MRKYVAVLCFVASALPLALGARAETGDAGAGIVLVPLSNDAGPPPAGYAPDPAPLVTRRQWVVELGYRSGSILFSGARRVEVAKPIATPRAMGRFAIELLVGQELVDRVRFDFPLLGADELGSGPTRWDSPPNFSRHLSSRIAVMVPDSARATRAVLLDRASGDRWALPWPFLQRGDAGAAP